MGKNYVITIGRQLGSGGSAAGKFIADHFGFQYIDKEILVKAGEKLGVSERNLELVDEKNSTIWTTLAQTTVPAVPYNSDAWFVPTGRQLFEVQSQIMREAVKNRSCVIIGRCSPHIFAGYEKHTSIFLQAHMDSRIARLEKTLGKTVDREVIEKKDKERARYYRTYTGKRWLDLSEYDFMLDTTPFDDQQLTEILLRYIYCRFPELKNKNLL